MALAAWMASSFFSWGILRYTTGLRGLSISGKNQVYNDLFHVYLESLPTLGHIWIIFGVDVGKYSAPWSIGESISGE